MEDRVSLYPGRVTLTPVSGQTNTYDMVRADEPTQEGTPLNKANLLKDTTAALYGLGTDAVPDEVFQKISEKDVFEVGDTLTTVRTDLPEKWLLCNGASVSKDEYPKLAGMLGIAPWLSQISNTAGILRGVARYKDTWVAVGNGYNSSVPYFYIHDNTATTTWTQISPASVSAYFQGVACYNGIWVAVGYTASGNYPYILTTTDPAGAWTGKQLSSTPCKLQDIACYDGIWVAVGYNSSNAPLICTTTDPTGTWTIKQLSSALCQPNGVACYNGTWVIVAEQSYSIYTTTDPTGTWTENQISESMINLRDVACYNGIWVAVGNPGNYPSVYTTTDPTGTWTANQLSSSSIVLSGVACDGGEWVAAGYAGTVSSTSAQYAYTFTTTNPTAGWAGKQHTSYLTQLLCVARCGIEWVAAGCYNNGSASYPTVVEALGDPTIPTISIDGAYTYIKAKE